jgi:(1->4)-alpha-D-glucan 1-alpha-D-glucosylmutase
MRPAALPSATYRLQLNAGFTFETATGIVDYLAALGVSHCYTSNYFKAVPGSLHGYDVADPTELNPEIGNEQTFNAWVSTLRSHGMGHIIDLVPNHMGIARSANPWWQDVLENGESSRYADVFDIDWKPLKPELEHKVLLPVLGGTYGEVLERQEIRLEYASGAFQARYFEHVFPIAPGTYDRILRSELDALLETIDSESQDGTELLSILTAIRHLPGRQEVDPARRAERHREKEVIKRRLASLTDRSPAVMAHIDRAVAAFNGTAGVPRSFDALDDLLSAQAYRLSYWRVAAEEINYRRFFDINELAAIRMEDPAVSGRAHALAFQLVQEGLVDGFRIDHVDGLYDPEQYLQWVQARAREVRPDVFTEERPLYLVVEKILAADEALPDWPVHGTTGYDFLVKLNGLFVDRENQRAVEGAYEQFTRLRVPYREIAYRGKQLILRVSMASELNVLAHRLNRFSERSRHYRDFTLLSLSQAMREIIACFPVYRTYVNGREASVCERDRRYIESAVNEAKRRNPNRPAPVYDFVRDLLLKRADFVPDADEHMAFVSKFQQVTSPVTAKGIEDTALYIYNPLVSLNEVGGEPDHFGISPDDLHAALTERARRWPYGLSATSTHDTKRSEDVRARIDALSELPGAWKQAAARWARINRRARTLIDGHSYPSRNEEFLFYQTVLGAWPLEPMDAAGELDFAERIVAYMQKAMREAKVFTSWINPSMPHEEAMAHFVRTVLATDNTAFREDFLELQRRLAQYGIYNSLAQLAVKVGAPGLPDFYQGTELWDFSLVDPDNRRPIDYDRRRQLLTALECDIARRGRQAVAAELVAAPHHDRLKLYTTSTMLRCRREHREIFEAGHYTPVGVEGPRQEHLFAFARTPNAETAGRRDQAIIVVPRLVAALLPETDVPPLGERIWADTMLVLPSESESKEQHYRNVLTDQCVVSRVDEHGRPTLRAADALASFPVALLLRVPAGLTSSGIGS